MKPHFGVELALVVVVEVVEVVEVVGRFSQSGEPVLQLSQGLVGSISFDKRKQELGKVLSSIPDVLVK